MLSPHDDDEEDDDSHLCIKCNTTIVGLDNYVRHRKQRCGKDKNPPKSVLPIDALEPTYGLGADFFFQSLELQSSVKKSSLSRLTPPTSISKSAIDNTSSLQVATTSRDVPRMSPLEGNLRGEDWIGGHSLKIGGNEDNQTKLIKAVASISGAVKKDIQSHSYNIGPFNDFKPDDDSDDLEDLEDDEDDDQGSKWKPPPTYTGGKWRPYSPENEEWDVREEQEHTGGKWKPPCTPDAQERDEDYDAPPPGHTKGKWLPGANEKTQIMQTTIQNRGSVQYWCGPCNRRLGSRAIYEKHLKSNLHRRKVLPEHDLEFSGHIRPISDSINKRVSRPSRYLNETIYLQPSKKASELKSTNQSTAKLKIKIKKKKRRRNPMYVNCSGCNSRVRTHLMGKHLISHYHFRKVSDTKSDVYRQLILDNMDAIVHQSPFQCSPCKFYTNWLSNFIQHFYSDEHTRTVNAMEGRYWCSFCKFECDLSDLMLNHLTSSEHGDVVAAVNRSMPIIIRKKTIFQCETCGEEFRYNIAVKKHCLRTNHRMLHTAADDYQQLHQCAHCEQKFKSSRTLAAHLKSKHKQKAYLCLVCSKSFDSADEVKAHRESSEHRVIARKQRLHKMGLPATELRKKCPYCTETVMLPTVLELKDHIREVHPNIKKKCPHCGKSFILPQEVSRHIRDGACSKPEVSGAGILWSCNQCSYTTDSQAECFFHETLHSDPVSIERGPSKTVIKKYKCSFCDRIFKKSYLRDHLRQHTFERPFACSICGANFTRQSSLAYHSRTEHSTPKVPFEVVQEMEDGREFRCQRCRRRFVNGLALSQHAARCEEGCEGDRRCTYDGCTYVAVSYAQLDKHIATHEDRKKYKCLLCSFKTNQATHLRRHMVSHEGTKPYACPYCEFSCAIQENLRKHVLKTRHRGCNLYRCRHCDFGVDLANAFRLHLLNDHPLEYDAQTALKTVKEYHMKRND
ncbi:zinc finger protein 28 [Aricia agestis]|uniref:zinc finger protein 28 n=1 Tax=Aricia agestis TaxID=91739 RepID=UPI001C206CB8|nr:zinc finger protein 28 [Aricia agestis]